jgi:hypothetical protein
MWCAIYLCCLMIVGYPLAALLARPATKWEVAGLGMCLGPGIMGFILILLSMLGVRPRAGEILAITAVFGIAGIWVWRFRSERQSLDLGVNLPPKWWMAICLVGLGYGIYSVVSDALITPVIEWDAFAIWQLKAEVLAVLPLWPKPGYFFDLNLSFSHLRYPILLPMISAGAHAMTGALDDLGKMVSLPWFFGMELLVFATVKRLNGWMGAITATALLGCCVPVMRYGGSGTAEMPLTAFYTGALVCIVRWRESGRWGYVILTGVFSAWMAWTKNEGIALAAINVLVMASPRRGWAWKKNLAGAAVVAAIVAILFSPWIIYSWGMPRTDEDYAGRLNVQQFVQHLDRVVIVLWGLCYGLFIRGDYGLFWWLVIVLVVWQWRRLTEPIVGIVGMLLVLHLLAYVPPLMVTTWKTDELIAVTMDRLLMHAAPAGAILIGLLWPRKKPPGRAGDLRVE